MRRQCALSFGVGCPHPVDPPLLCDVRGEVILQCPRNRRERCFEADSQFASNRPNYGSVLAASGHIHRETS